MSSSAQRHYQPQLAAAPGWRPRPILGLPSTTGTRRPQGPPLGSVERGVESRGSILVACRRLLPWPPPPLSCQPVPPAPSCQTTGTRGVRRRTIEQRETSLRLTGKFGIRWASASAHLPLGVGYRRAAIVRPIRAERAARTGAGPAPGRAWRRAFARFGSLVNLPVSPPALTTCPAR